MRAMRQALIRHPDTLCEAVTGLRVDVSRPEAPRLVLRYWLEGEPGLLRLPAVGTPRREDGLWRRTCFEAFVRAVGSEAYFEFNFAPSTQWAAYRFDAYRAGMEEASDLEPRIVVTPPSNGVFTLDVSVDLGEELAVKQWLLGIAAVVEEASGRISYWALNHPAGKPDFHHQAGFTLELPGVSPR